MEGNDYLIRYARTDGSRFDVIKRTPDWQTAYDGQVQMYRTSIQYASGGGSRFQDMIDMNWRFVKELEKLKPQTVPAEVKTVSRIINSNDADGGLMRGAAMGLSEAFKM